MPETSTTWVVIWEGEYQNDALERKRWIRSAANRVQDILLVGSAGDWKLVIEAPAHDPKAA